ncbi:hypothetical protein DT076_12980 [Desertihabitans brevis]|uniref:Type II secretion system protein n=2 Tax=Desertihabitans brevis TaxID=2268447 RepID=A0A367YTQ8_9ACTN|nr:hypothetical protein DT076_12980 [Desertihabitans brevis]
MAVLALALGVAAALLWCGPSAEPGWHRRLEPVPVAVEPVGAPARRRLVLAVPAAGIVVLGAVGVSWGIAAAVVTACLLVLGGTAAWVVHGQLREHREQRRADEVARACAVLAGELRVGKVPGDALTTAAEDHPLLASAAAVHRSGGDSLAVLERAADRPGAGGLRPVVEAWRLCQRTGASMTDALDRVSAALRADREVQRVVRAELAAARATGRLMAVLPLVGLALGYAIGGDPISFLLSSWVGQLCLLGGVLLACGGVLWSERLAS